MIRVHEIHSADKANHGLNLPALFPNGRTPLLQVDSLGFTGGILHLSRSLTRNFLRDILNGFNTAHGGKFQHLLSHCKEGCLSINRKVAESEIWGFTWQNSIQLGLLVGGCLFVTLLPFEHNRQFTNVNLVTAPRRLFPR
jgi:hypothetical protein